MTTPLPDPVRRGSGVRPGPAPWNSTPPAPAPAHTVRYARFLPATNAEGPGTRAALWLQGCGIRCPGCFNPHLWTSRGGTQAEAGELARSFAEQALRAGAEGLTLLGGEPFEQAAGAAVIAAGFRSAGLGVMTFTGYTHADLVRWARERPDIAALLDATDLLADGPYLADRPERQRPWIGSTNQGLTALTPRYLERIPTAWGASGAAPDALRDAVPGAGPVSHGDRLEVRISPAGTVEVNGWAESAQLEYLLEGLRRPAPPPADPPGRAPGRPPGGVPNASSTHLSKEAS